MDPHLLAVEVDLRVGGGNRIVIQSPDGQKISCSGTYLETMPNQCYQIKFNPDHSVGAGQARFKDLE